MADVTHISSISFKFVITGDSGTGKSCILRRLVEDSFEATSQSTIGVEFDSIVFEIDGCSVKLQIWDTAGQERFASISKAYYRNALGVLLVFDVTERKSFDNIGRWLADVHTLCDPGCLILLVGNKVDLAIDRQVSMGEAECLATKHQLLYTETSALTGHNIRELFLDAAVRLFHRQPHQDVGVAGVAVGAGKKRCC